MLGRPASPVKFRSTDSTGAVRPIPALGTPARAASRSSVPDAFPRGASRSYDEDRAVAPRLNGEDSRHVPGGRSGGTGRLAVSVPPYPGDVQNCKNAARRRQIERGSTTD